ncbi:hypothetical protein RR46_07830 [Papilio xuthus]|uniref:Uncharacterized protein n=1 Tax=Papilio xuthus TaxID=66420 RepID=A0A194QKU5_PAPXU|nr:hypothetical protein RR46_07830 [Papilio xuthus]
MDEDKKQASHPSTSKIEDRSNNSRQDVREEEQDVQSNSFVSESSVFTDNSYITTANEAQEISKINRIMKEISDQKKGKTHRVGKVQRRRARPRASQGLRRPVKYEPRSRNTRRTRDFSVSTLFRGMQTRYWIVVVCIQAGSTSKMLSSLFMNTNNQLMDNENDREDYNEMNYPVTPNITLLERDLREKLYIATVSGIVTDLKNDNWELTTSLQEQRLTDTHVTLFWKIYADTMTPVTLKKNVPEPDKNSEYAEIDIR